MCGMAEVEVDLETGQIDVINYKAAVDCGTVINRHLRGYRRRAALSRESE